MSTGSELGPTSPPRICSQVCRVEVGLAFLFAWMGCTGTGMRGSNHIHFTHEFCYYLGSYLTTDLCNDPDITVCIRKPTQQVGALTNFFSNKAVVVVAVFYTAVNPGLLLQTKF
jgi:hypothetical protein